SAPLTTRPCEEAAPEPEVKALSKPAVPPTAEAENWSSEMSMVQAPLPTGRPASVAWYCASSLPWAKAGPVVKPKRPANRLKPTSAGSTRTARPGEVNLDMITEGQSSRQQDPAQREQAVI